MGIGAPYGSGKIDPKSIRPITEEETILPGEIYLKGPIYGWKGHIENTDKRVNISKNEKIVKDWIKEHVETGEIDADGTKFEGSLPLYRKKE